MGIWSENSDGTDVNAIQRSRNGRHIITGDDFGNVKMFNAPCVVGNAPHKIYHGHSSHVTGVSFLKHDSHVVTIGGKDRGILQWKYNMLYEAFYTLYYFLIVVFVYT